MKLTIMTKSTFFVEEDKILTNLFDEGLESLHLYKPDSSPLLSERLLSLMPEDYMKYITVHGHFYLKDEYGLAGIHLDDAGASVPEGYKGKVSRTCRDLGLLKQMKKRSQYVFLRNIFDNIETTEEKATFNMTELEDAADKGLIDKHVYALGGITLDNMHIMRELGFGGVVICGDLWNRFDIHNGTDYKEIINYFNLLRKAAD